jgi:hypothetical protein
MTEPDDPRDEPAEVAAAVPEGSELVSSHTLQTSYVARNVQIGTGRGGMRPLAQDGAVVLGEGQLLLVGSKGDLLEQVAVSEVTARRARRYLSAMVWVSWDDRRYLLGIGVGGTMTFAMGWRAIAGRRGAKKFCAALAAEQQGYTIGETTP